MTTNRYQLIEYDPARPWIVLATEHRTIDLPEGQSFETWARRRFPDDRFRVLPERETERWQC